MGTFVDRLYKKKLKLVANSIRNIGYTNRSKGTSSIEKLCKPSVLVEVYKAFIDGQQKNVNCTIKVELVIVENIVIG